MQVKHKSTLVEHVHAGTIHQELHHAIAYCQMLVSQLDWLMALGAAAATATPKAVMHKVVGDFSTQYTSDEVKFGGVLGMLDVVDRVTQVDDKDIGRARWHARSWTERRDSVRCSGTLRRVARLLRKTCGAQRCSDG